MSPLQEAQCGLKAAHDPHVYSEGNPQGYDGHLWCDGYTEPTALDRIATALERIAAAMERAQ